MVILSGYGTMPHQRQNRRRERPGSRKRHTTRRSHIQSGAQTDFEEAILDAHDSSVPLPSDRSKPSPLLRQNFDQSWQRWKARQAEEKAIAEMDRMQLEQEQIKLFGGDVDDDELYRMGILYKDEGTALNEFNSIARDVPVQQSAPMFVIRPSRPRKRAQRSSWRILPLYLSLSDLSTDADIARLLSPSTSYASTIQHRDTHTTDIPQSLPPTSALGSTHFLDNMSFSHLDFNSGDWTFISAAPHTPLVSSPSSEPETWILLSDDS